jgi:single-strand DNA-binding protein
MSSFNRAVLVGRLTRDPEIKYTPQGTQLAKFSLAVDRARQKGETDFINITAWGKLAEICGQYLSKGKLVLIEGEIRTRSYETQDGQKRSSFEINANSMQMLGSKSDGGSASAPTPADAPYYTPVDVDSFDAEDMPF